MYELKFYCPVCGEQKVIIINDIKQEPIKEYMWCRKHRIHIDYDCEMANLKISSDLYLNEVKQDEN